MGPEDGNTRSPTRADVLRTAEALLAGEGVEALTMRRLASALGTSYQVVYSRVGAKPDVVRALHADGFARLCRAVDDVGGEPGTEQHLIGMGHGYLAMAAAHPALFDVMFGTPIPEFVRDDAARAVEWEGFKRTWVAACRTWLDRRHADRPRGASVRLAWRLWTAIHGITVLHLAGHGVPGDDVEGEMAAVVRLLLRDPLG